MADLDLQQISSTEPPPALPDQARQDTSKVQVPGYVKGQLGADGEALLKEIEKDPTLAEKLPKGIPDLFKSWRTLQQESTSAVRVPAKDAPKEAWDRYFKAIGRPDSPEGYALQKPQLPNGLPYNDKLEKWFRQQLFNAGVPDGAAQKMFNDWNAMQTATFQSNQKFAQEQAQKFASQAMETLKAEWKDDYPKNIETMKSALARFGGQDIVSVFQQARLPNGLTLDNHPAVAKMLYEIGKRMGEDTMVGADGFARKNTGREFVNPVTGKKIEGFYPLMDADPRFRIKTE